MRHTGIPAAILLLALSPAVAHADDKDDLEATMTVLDDPADVEDSMRRMDRPDDSDVGGDEPRNEGTDDDSVVVEFEYDDVYDEDELEDEDDFEEGEDVDEDRFDE